MSLIHARSTTATKADGSPAVEELQSTSGALDVFLSGGSSGSSTVIPDNADGLSALGATTDGVVARIQGWNGTTFDRLGSQGDNADGVAVETLGHLKAINHSYLFNGTTWDRKRGNTEVTALASAARTTSTNSGDIINYNGSGCVVFLNITAAPGGDTVQIRIVGKDPVSSSYTTILTGVATAATGITTTILTPGNSLYLLPRIFRITVTHSGAGSFTYSVGVSIGGS